MAGQMRAAHRPGRGRARGRLVDDLAERRPCRRPGSTTSISSGLRTPASTMVTGRGAARRSVSSVPPRKRAISSSGRCVADRPMRCGAGRRRPDPVVEPLEGEGQVAAPLGGGQRVDLVDDHGLDAAQRLAGRRREHQVQRLGRGDEDVGRVAHELAALVGRRCRRCACRRWARCSGTPEPLGRQARCPAAGRAGSSRRRRPAPAAARRRGAGCGASASSGVGSADEPVDGPEEGGERLARAGGGQDQRVVAARRWPASPGPGAAWARGTTSRTRPGRPGRTARAGSTSATPTRLSMACDSVRRLPGWVAPMTGPEAWTASDRRCSSSTADCGFCRKWARVGLQGRTAADATVRAVSSSWTSSPLGLVAPRRGERLVLGRRAGPSVPRQPLVRPRAATRTGCRASSPGWIADLARHPTRPDAALPAASSATATDLPAPRRVGNPLGRHAPSPAMTRRPTRGHRSGRRDARVNESDISDLLPRAVLARTLLPREVPFRPECWCPSLDPAERGARFYLFPRRTHAVGESRIRRVTGADRIQRSAVRPLPDAASRPSRPPSSRRWRFECRGEAARPGLTRGRASSRRRSPPRCALAPLAPRRGAPGSRGCRSCWGGSRRRSCARPASRAGTSSRCWTGPVSSGVWRISSSSAIWRLWFTSASWLSITTVKAIALGGLDAGDVPGQVLGHDRDLALLDHRAPVLLTGRAGGIVRARRGVVSAAGGQEQEGEAAARAAHGRDVSGARRRP